MCMITGMQKVRIGENCESGVTDYHGRRTDKIDRACRLFGFVRRWFVEVEGSACRHTPPWFDREMLSKPGRRFGCLAYRRYLVGEHSADHFSVVQKCLFAIT